MRGCCSAASVKAFPAELAPVSGHPPLASLASTVACGRVFRRLVGLSLSVCAPSLCVLRNGVRGCDRLFSSGGDLARINHRRNVHHLATVGLVGHVRDSICSFGLAVAEVGSLVDGAVGAVSGCRRRASRRLRLASVASVSRFSNRSRGSSLFSFNGGIGVSLTSVSCIS